MPNLKQVYAKKQETMRRILAICPDIPRSSGIYIFHRVDESGIKYAYVGQAKHLLDRCASHLLGYQHIDLSLKKHGLKSTDKPYGYELHYICFPESELDTKEREYIQKCAIKGYQLRNATLGGQDEGKNVIDLKPTKGYHDGLKQGYRNAITEIKEFFDKYLDYSVKECDESHKKDGSLKEIYIRKLNEFKEMLENEV